MNIEREMVATRVNHQPASLLGISSSELSVLILLGGVLFLLTNVVGFFIGLSFFSPVVGIVLAAALVVASAARLRAVKRNRPDRYYVHAVWYFFAKRIPGFAGEIVLRSGSWVTGRDSKK